MKATILQENLLSALSHVSRNAASKATLPVLTHTLITTHDAHLTFSTTNLESSLTITKPATIATDGNITVPARLMHEFVANLPPGEVVLQNMNQTLICESGQFRASIATIPPGEFPPLPQFPEGQGILIPLKYFLSAIEKVVFAASSDEGRQALTGVLIFIHRENITLVATDGYRLGKTVIQGIEGITEHESIVPARSLLEATRVFSNHEDEELTLAFSANQLIIKGTQAVFSSRTIEGQFPPYQKIIPTQFTTRIVVDHSELLRAVRVASVFAKDSANIIKISTKPGDQESLRLSAQTAQVGDEHGRVEASVEGEALDIAFNGKYLTDVISALRASQISIELSGSLSPGLFRAVGDEYTLHIIMPIRIQE